ncbi:hypothetical protein AMTRI_Chr02g255520 [Amborella trichopoda]|uniref:Uncharacterized protein n=1 Tax=Amborella trichopoda TaxID=13333 RepID=U5CXX0_AMBTC|nr:regulatory protein NPR3 [Amborella trichopoda]ERN14825.1 hypothetical protein AMTR_s00032p00112510 [Amborella trichopoda]|eukprot:XP_020528413.1 regulatory protein NPR3 [Amborella trichopoda]
MENPTESSCSRSFASSSYVSNGSSCANHSVCNGSEPGSCMTGSQRNTTPGPEINGLMRLSTNLENLLHEPYNGFSDAEIEVEGVPIGVHRCILAARSSVFREVFSREKKHEGKPKYSIEELVPSGKVGYEAFRIVLNYLYTGRLKSAPPEVSTCVEKVCAHDDCRPAVDFAVEVVRASAVFQIQELGSVWQRRLLSYVEKAQVEDVIPILLVASSCHLSPLDTHCIQRMARSDLDDISLEKSFSREIVEEILSLRLKSRIDDEPLSPKKDPLQLKNFKRIHKALDSDDLELVKMLLMEGNTTLDDAEALHYAAAYCDSKVVAELLELGGADVNKRNSRGYTVLHVAAMRQEPAVLVALLSKEARACELTSDGRSGARICRRLTTPKDYNTHTEQGQESRKEKMCIDILEREERRNPLVENVSASAMVSPEELHMKLLYLENRVAFARVLFPTEAKLAMDNAQAGATTEFAGHSPSTSSRGTLGPVDLNETPTSVIKKMYSRMAALQRTVDMGRRYFPHCSEVLDKLMEDDMSDLLFLENGTLEEQRVKRQRFNEVKDDVQKAFTKDQVLAKSGTSSSSSTSSLKDRLRHRPGVKK